VIVITDSNRFRLFWIIVGGGALGLALFISVLMLAWFFRPSPQPKAPATAVVNIIPAPTATPIIFVPSPTPSPTPEMVPQASADIRLGAYVQITGTGTDGLRLRVSPGLQSDVRLVAIEAEVFQVEDGPRDADGYTWWYLVAPYDNTHYGWAVANYLAVVQNP
jgi:hypothetical protein